MLLRYILTNTTAFIIATYAFLGNSSHACEVLPEDRFSPISLVYAGVYFYLMGAQKPIGADGDYTSGVVSAVFDHCTLLIFVIVAPLYIGLTDRMAVMFGACCVLLEVVFALRRLRFTGFLFTLLILLNGAEDTQLMAMRLCFGMIGLFVSMVALSPRKILVPNAMLNFTLQVTVAAHYVDNSQLMFVWTSCALTLLAHVIAGKDCKPLQGIMARTALIPDHAAGDPPRDRRAVWRSCLQRGLGGSAGQVASSAEGRGGAMVKYSY